MLGIVGSVVMGFGVWTWTSADAVDVALPTPATSTPGLTEPGAADRRPAVPPVPTPLRGSWAPGAPRTLAAPAAGIRAPVLPIRARGEVLTPPADPDVLGWWSDGVPVGAPRGTALVTGHAVSGGGGALDNVAAIGQGDRLTVRTAKGRMTYRVRRVVTLDKDELADQSQDLFRQDGPHRLALVTCADWDGTAFRSNTVILAEPVPSAP